MVFVCGCVQGAEVVRLKNGFVVDPDSLSRKETRRLGYTVQVEIQEEMHSRNRKEQQLTGFDTGRRKARKNSGLILGEHVFMELCNARLSEGCVRACFWGE